MLKIIKGIDKPLLIISIILFALGLVTIYSASNVTAYMLNEADPSRYFVKELIFLVCGFLMALVIVHIPTKKYGILSWLATIIIGVVIFVLALLGQMVNGMSGWINYNGLGIQPSEFVKVAIIPLIATFYDSNIKSRDNVFRMLVPMIVSLFIAFAIVLQGDIGTAIIFLGLCILMFFFSPVSKKIKVKMFSIGFLLLAFLGLILLVGGDKIIPEDKLARFNYDNPCSRYTTTGNQLCNGYIAINGGGLTGKGLGNSTQKYLYLPEAYTDFIFPIAVEELGVIICSVLILGFLYIIFRIIYIAKKASNLRNSIICYGIAMYLLLHLLINFLGILALIPLTGVPVPFFSYGGSFAISVIVAMFLVQRVAIESKNDMVRRDIDNF